MIEKDYVGSSPHEGASISGTVYLDALEGDSRKLSVIFKSNSIPFDVVVNDDCDEFMVTVVGSWEINAYIDALKEIVKAHEDLSKYHTISVTTQ